MKKMLMFAVLFAAVAMVACCGNQNAKDGEKACCDKEKTECCDKAECDKAECDKAECKAECKGECKAETPAAEAPAAEAPVAEAPVAEAPAAK